MTIWPLETISNVIQMLALLVLVVFLWFRADKTKRPMVVKFYTFGLFSYFMGDLFWALYQLLLNEAPDGFSASDLVWLGSFCIFTGIIQMRGVDKMKQPWWVWAVPAIVVANAVSWDLLWSDNYINNGLWGVVLTIYAWYIAAGFNSAGKAMKPYYISNATMLLVDLIMFQSWGIVYTIMNFVMTANMIVMPLLLLRCIERDADDREGAER